MSALKESLIIHPDVEIVPFEDLADDVQSSLDGSPGDVAVSRSGTRSVSRIIDAETAGLLLHFRTATRVPSAVVRYATSLGEEPSDVLRDALPVLGDLHAAGVLATERELEEPSHMTLAPGTVFLGFEVESCLQAFADSGVYRVRHGEGSAILKVGVADGVGVMDPGFVNEATRLGDLANVACVPELVDRGTADGYDWLLIEHRKGVSVARAANRFREDGEHELRPL